MKGDWHEGQRNEWRTGVTIDLPYPPTLNTYWRHAGNRVLISAKGRAYRRTVICELALSRAPKQSGRLSVHITAFMPDRRVRDLDNLPKAALDALTHAGLWADDSQIDRLAIERGPVEKGGRLRVRVMYMLGAPL